MDRRSWLSMWMDEQGVLHERDLSSALSSPRGKRTLLRSMEEARDYRPPEKSKSASKVAAGTRLDLSASLGGCTHVDCLTRDAESLVARTCLYFDEVIVSGPNARHYRERIERDSDTALRQLEGFAGMLLRLRELGAEDLLTFRDKPPPCAVHLRKHAQEVGITHLLGGKQAWVEQASSRATLSATWVGKQPGCPRSHWRLRVDDLFDHTQWLTIHAPRGSRQETVGTRALEELWEQAFATLTSDVRFSRTADAALGIGLEVHQELRANEVIPSADDVAFHVELPTAAGRDLREVLKLCRDEADSRKAFQAALRRAMKERLSASAGKNAVRADAVAQEVRQDVIDPALASISNRLKASKRLLMRGSATSLGIVAITTTVGMVTNVPVEFAGLVGALLGAPDIQRTLSDRKDIELSDFYFLWRATNAVSGGAAH